MMLLCSVSQPIMSDLVPIAEFTTHVPPYEEINVQQQWARQVPNPLQIIANIDARVESVMEPPDVFMSPVFTSVLLDI